MNDTIFGKIIRGEIPATKVYEDEQCLAFLDINPVSNGHTLLIPKEHFIWMQEVPDELLSYLFVTAKKLMIAMKEALKCDYIQVDVVGKDIPHFHIHLMPRYYNDGLHGYKTFTYKHGETEEIAQKITSEISKPA